MPEITLNEIELKLKDIKNNENFFKNLIKQKFNFKIKTLNKLKNYNKNFNFLIKINYDFF